jgi:hypothetical protein
MNPEQQSVYKAALVVLVPEAEPLAGPFRDQYDPSAADGMPAHITLNYPFLAYDPGQAVAIDELGRLFSSYAPFRFWLAEIRRFPQVLYLAPDPAQLFKDLIQAVAGQYPASPPYGGLFADVIPHLTVADLDDAEALERINGELVTASRDKLPIEAVAEEVWLMAKEDGRWLKRVSFPLGGGSLER